MGAPDFWLVMPCFDEAARLDSAALLAFLDQTPDVGLMMVDDGSQDDTLATLRRLAASAPAGRVDVLGLATNHGKGEAVRQGMLAVLTHHRARVVGFWDADLSAPLSVLDELRSALDADPRRRVVIAARVKLLGARIERLPLRHYGGRAIATMISLTLGLPVYDTQCGAKLFVVDDGLAALLSTPFRSRWLFDVELLSRWLRANPGEQWRQGLCEVPISRWQHAQGSKVTVADAVRAPLEVLAIGWRHRR